MWIMWIWSWNILEISWNILEYVLLGPSNSLNFMSAGRYADSGLPKMETCPPCSTKAEKFEHGNDQGPAGKGSAFRPIFCLGAPEFCGIYSKGSQRDPKGSLWDPEGFYECLWVMGIVSVSFCLAFQYSENLAVLDANCKVSTRSTCRRRCPAVCTPLHGNPGSLTAPKLQ